MSMSFANPAPSAEYMARKYACLKKNVYLVSEDIANEIARLKLAAMNVSIDTLTEEQERYLASWEMGT